MSIEVLEKAVDQIEARLQNSLEREIPSARIGEYALEQLQHIDPVAYVRFASVYRQFTDIDSFYKEIDRLLRTKGKEPS